MLNFIVCSSGKRPARSRNTEIHRQQTVLTKTRGRTGPHIHRGVPAGKTPVGEKHRFRQRWDTFPKHRRKLKKAAGVYKTLILFLLRAQSLTQQYLGTWAGGVMDQTFIYHLSHSYLQNSSSMTNNWKLHGTYLLIHQTQKTQMKKTLIRTRYDQI